MKVSVDHILDKPLLLNFEEHVQAFQMLAEMQRDQYCRFTGPIRGELSIEREFDHIRLNGRVTAPIELSCSRCLLDYDALIDSNFTIFFRKDVSSHDDEDEVELGEKDLISSSYSGDEIELTREIEEQVAMEIPLKPLCSHACKGLCQVCGTDLNKSQCSCSNENVSLKFSALKDFKVSI
ncbi:MAG: DUF177 domain-containing protein [Deltaproteobacteria bacterium]|nr:DUF177 domain-containing protein [Deltaproteobacteria bacterium]